MRTLINHHIFQNSSELKIYLLAFIISLFAHCTAGAQTLDALIAGAQAGSAEDQYTLGEKYLQGKDYTNAREWLGKAAEQGNVKAQTKMGWIYEQGKGVKRNYEIAFSWYEKAAIQGDGYAQRPLGKFYELGLGVEPDPEKAFYWYEKAAMQGIARAQANLGILYETGVGVERNYEQAVYWYKQSVAKPYPRGEYLLGKMYEQGLGVEQNIDVAKMWYKKSAANKYSRAINRLEILETKGPEKITTDQEKKSSLAKVTKQETKPEADKPKQQQATQTDKKTAPPSTVAPAVPSEDLPDIDSTDHERAAVNAQKHFSKGNEYYKNGLLEEAVSEYKKSLAYKADSANTLANLGITYADLGELDKAIKVIRDSISVKPSNSETYALLGIMLHSKEREKEAMIQYRKAIKYNPTLAEIYFYMAFIFAKSKDYDNAWKSLHMAEFFGYQDKELRPILLSASKEPKTTWPSDKKGYYLRQIVVSTREKAEKVRQQLIDGGNFSDLVKSDGLEQYRENGGYLGYLKADEISHNTLKLVENLPPFGYSEILETDNGFHIFQRLMLFKELYATSD